MLGNDDLTKGAAMILRPTDSREADPPGSEPRVRERTPDRGSAHRPASAGPVSAVLPSGAMTPGAPPQVTFDRLELNRILNLYGRMVAAGEWRDYAIDFMRERAVFSIFRRASEVPIYRIEKDPKLARKQGAYSVISATGLILRRGHELERVLRVIDKPLKVVAN